MPCGWIIPVIGVVALTAQSPLAARESDDWMQRADIVEIRSIHREIETAITDETLKGVPAPERCLREATHLSEATSYIDGHSVVRKLSISYGTDDSAGSAAYYYDRDGRHRFTYHRVAAVNGTSQELRVYFDDSGRQLHADRRLLEGPGYPTGIDIHVPDPRLHLDRLCDAR